MSIIPSSSATQNCVHRWQIATRAQQGAFPAHCRHCGQRRSFPLLDYDDLRASVIPVRSSNRPPT
ncbi:MAG: hypothetical protein O7A71_04065 [Chloroflexi bacterium]|nr:hypothetical protein [Chloroflexota bacterium]